MLIETLVNGYPIILVYEQTSIILHGYSQISLPIGYCDLTLDRPAMGKAPMLAIQAKPKPFTEATKVPTSEFTAALPSTIPRTSSPEPGTPNSYHLLSSSLECSPLDAQPDATVAEADTSEAGAEMMQALMAFLKQGRCTRIIG